MGALDLYNLPFLKHQNYNLGVILVGNEHDPQTCKIVYLATGDSHFYKLLDPRANKSPSWKGWSTMLGGARCWVEKTVLRGVAETKL